MEKLWLYGGESASKNTTELVIKQYLNLTVNLVPAPFWGKQTRFPIDFNTTLQQKPTSVHSRHA